MPPKRRALREIDPNSANTPAANENDTKDLEAGSVEKISEEVGEIRSDDEHTDVKTPEKELLRPSSSAKPAPLKSARINPRTTIERQRRRQGLVEDFKRQMNESPMIQDWKTKVHHNDDVATDQASEISPGRRELVTISEEIPSFDSAASFILPRTSRAAGKRHSAGIEIRRGDTVELTNGSFIRIRDTYPAHEPEPVIEGDLFDRNTALGGWLPKIENEVYWLWGFDGHSGEHAKHAESFLARAKTSEVVRKRKIQFAPPNVTLYNRLRNPCPSVEEAKNNTTGRGTLICRWKYLCPWDGKNRIAKKIYLRKRFVETALIAIAASSDDHSLEGPSTTTHESHRPDRYTLGDAFAGCGGISRAAQMAGLKVQWGFDNNWLANQSYKRNFGGTKTLEMSADDFVASHERNFHVDILHLSPPCQFFSRAHSVPGRNDFENVKTLFYIPAIIDRTKPRVVTLEQVDNIISQHAVYFAHLVQFFTYAGYSIRWKIINCADFGVAQKGRVRLFVIGSSPGNNLPHFPSPTHCEQTSSSPPPNDLKPQRTVADAINHIEPGSSDNKPGSVVIPNGCLPYDLNAPHPEVVRSGRSEYKYMYRPTPDGRKPFTIREVAGLQSFPTYHKFCGSRHQKWNQIGNAVPPWVGHAIFQEVKKSLRRSDAGLSDDVDVDWDKAPDADKAFDSDNPSVSDPDSSSDYDPNPPRRTRAANSRKRKASRPSSDC